MLSNYDAALLVELEQRYGIDLAFETSGSNDVIEGETDYSYVSGPLALKEELERLFNLTQVGDLIDDPSYGLDRSFIGTALNPEVSTQIVKIAVLKALQHPSFSDRFRVRSLDCVWSPDEPNAVRVFGLLDLFGFEGVETIRFGPYALYNLISR